MERLNLALSSLKAVKGGHVSRSRVDAVGECALKALKVKSSGEIAEVLAVHCKSSSSEQRLAAIYALHSVVYGEKKKLEEKQGSHRTEKRGELSIALESKLEPIFVLLKDSAAKDREQVGKILAKWQERGVFPAELCRRLAVAASCTLPAPSSSASSSSSSSSSAAPGSSSSSATGAPRLTAPTYQPPAAISVDLGASSSSSSYRGAPVAAAATAPAASKPSGGGGGGGGGWGSFARPAAAYSAPPPPATTSSSSSYYNARDSGGGGRGRSAERRRPASPPYSAGSSSSYSREKRSRWGD